MKAILISFLCIFTLVNLANAQNSEQLYNDYVKKRSETVAKDDEIKDGSGIILTENERSVEEYLSTLRDEFIENSNGTFPPSYYFYRYRNIVDSCKILGILRLMPKGGLLHCHSSAIGSPDWLMEKALYMDNLYMYTGETKDRKVYGSLGFYKEGSQPGGYELVSDLRKSKPDFDAELRSLLFINENDFLNPEIWVRFEEIFTRQGELLKYYPLFIEYNLVAIDSLIADNVQHLEIRTFLSSVYDLDGNKYNNEEVLQLYKQILDSVKTEHPEFNLKLIRSGYRGWTNEDVLGYFEQTFQLRKANPDFLMGFDLVGEEDAGHTTYYFMKEFLKRDSLEKVYGVDMPFYFHDGESTLPTDDNLYDAVLLNSRRIGHGINLFRFPVLFDKIKEQDIALEVCPLSNQILGYVQDLRMHPASEYINRGIPITISSDDPQLFDYSGLSYDYWSAFMAWNLSLAQMKQIALNSLIYSAMNDNEKTAAFDHFEKKWDEWIETVLKMSN